MLSSVKISGGSLRHRKKYFEEIFLETKEKRKIVQGRDGRRIGEGGEMGAGATQTLGELSRS